MNHPDQAELLGPAKVSDIGTFDKVLELEREIKVRRQVYPRAVQNHKLSRDQANKRILIMEAILEDYKKIMAAEAGEMPKQS